MSLAPWGKNRLQRGAYSKRKAILYHMEKVFQSASRQQLEPSIVPTYPASKDLSPVCVSFRYRRGPNADNTFELHDLRTGRKRQHEEEDDDTVTRPKTSDSRSRQRNRDRRRSLWVIHPHHAFEASEELVEEMEMYIEVLEVSADEDCVATLREMRGVLTKFSRDIAFYRERENARQSRLFL